MRPTPSPIPEESASSAEASAANNPKSHAHEHEGYGLLRLFTKESSRPTPDLEALYTELRAHPELSMTARTILQEMCCLFELDTGDEGGLVSGLTVSREAKAGPLPRSL